MTLTDCTSLISALEVRPRELVSLVGGGGKTVALHTLVRECVAERPDGRVLATTTTAMFLRQLEAAGPVSLEADRSRLVYSVMEALAAGGAVAAARAADPGGKVLGLPTQWVDQLWSARVADRIVVEADGSKGMSLKAFAPHEPQVPLATTLLVQVAGLDALDAPLEEPPVHRAEFLAASLGVPTGTPLTPDLFARALGDQLRVLRRHWSAARIVTVLNKADDDRVRAAGLRVAELLLAGAPAGDGRPTGKGAPAGDGRPRPDAVVVGSLSRGCFTRVVRPGPTVPPIVRPRVSAIVLAAGVASRMGSQKLLLPLDGRAMVLWAVEAATTSQAAETVVVVGSDAQAVRATLEGYPVKVVENADYELGMSTSLRAGLAAVRPDCEAVIFVLGDHPFVTAAIIDRLIARFAERGSRIVRPVIEGRPVHPVLLAAPLFPEILGLEGDVGAREVLARHPEQVELTEADDPLLAMDVDTPKGYEAALKANRQRPTPPR